MSENQETPRARASRGRRITVASLVCLGLATGGVVAAEASFASGGGSSSPSSPGTSNPAAPKPPAAPGANDLDGTVTAASSSSLTVKNQFGTSRTFTITDDTSVHRARTKLTAASLEVGQRVHVNATKSGSTYTAKDVDVHLAHIDGVVASLRDDAVTVTDDDGFTRTIALSSDTKYTKDGKSADRGDLTGTSVIHAEGRVAGDGTTLDAATVDIRTKDAAPKGPGGGPAGGKAGGPAGGPAGVPAPGKAGKTGKGGPPAPPKNGSAPKAPAAPTGAPSGAPSAPSGGASSGS